MFYYFQDKHKLLEGNLEFKEHKYMFNSYEMELYSAPSLCQALLLPVRPGQPLLLVAQFSLQPLLSTVKSQLLAVQPLLQSSLAFLFACTELPLLQSWQSNLLSNTYYY
jgi:hypothetical protein